MVSQKPSLQFSPRTGRSNPMGVCNLRNHGCVSVEAQVRSSVSGFEVV